MRHPRYPQLRKADKEDRYEFTAADGPAPDSHTGLAGMAKAWRGFLKTWEDLRAQPEEYREIDDERVLVYVRDRGRGKASGMEVGQIVGTEDGVILSVIRDAKVVNLVNYFHRERALADVGPAAEADAPD